MHCILLYEARWYDSALHAGGDVKMNNSCTQYQKYQNSYEYIA